MINFAKIDCGGVRSEVGGLSAFKVVLALLLCLACIPVQSLSFAKKAWASEGDASFYFVLYGQKETGYDLVLQYDDQQDKDYGEKEAAFLVQKQSDRDRYAVDNNSGWDSLYSSSVKRVLMKDEISLSGSISTLFGGLSECESIDLSKLDTSDVTDMAGLFYACSSLTFLDLSGLETASVTDMREMFCMCSSLKSLDLSGLNTSAVTDMSCMFSMCSSLESLDLSGLDTSAVKYMAETFAGCSSLESLSLSGLDMRAVRDMEFTFSDCSSLNSLDLSGLDMSSVRYLGWMFSGCSSLESLDLSGFKAESFEETDGMFGGCSALSRVVLAAAASREFGRWLPDKTWVHESGRSFTPANFPEGLGGVYTVGSPSSGTDVPGEGPVNPPASSDEPVVAPQPAPPTSTKPDPISLAAAQVTVKSKAYTGKTLKPSSVTVKVGGEKLVSGRDYTVSCKGGKAVGSYKVTVKGKGAYAGTKSATFQIVPKGTSVSKTKAAKRGFTVTWKKPSKANLKQTTGYKVQWSTDKSFKKSVKSKLVKKNKTTSLKVSKLKGGKKYYVRVCTYKKAGGKYYYSSWSKAKAVKTKK